MPQIKESTVNSDTLFNLDGLDYAKSIYTVYYDSDIVDSSGVVQEDQLRVGLRNSSNQTPLELPKLVNEWEDATGTPYNSLSTLLQDLSDLVGFNSPQGGGGEVIPSDFVFTGADRAAAELARDTYFTDNPSKLKPGILIALVFGTPEQAVQQLRTTSDTWIDLGKDTNPYTDEDADLVESLRNVDYDGDEENFIPVKTGPNSFGNSSLRETDDFIISTKTIQAPDASLRIGNYQLSNYGFILAQEELAASKIYLPVVYELGDNTTGEGIRRVFSAPTIENVTQATNTNETFSGDVQFETPVLATGIALDYRLTSENPATDVNIVIRLNSPTSEPPVFDYKRAKGGVGFDLNSGLTIVDLPNPLFFEAGTPLFVSIESSDTLSLKGETILGQQVPFATSNARLSADSIMATQEYVNSMFEGRYRGLWNPNTNTPDLTALDPSPEVGDFFYVSQTGTYNGVDYEINDRIQYNGTDWDRIPAADPWEYVNADDNYDVTASNNRNYVDYFLTANKDITLPALTPADEGWLCTIVNSSTFRLRVFGTTTGSRRLNRGGSLMLLWNGTGYVVLNYITSSTILSTLDFENSSVSYNNTIYVNADTDVLADEMDGSLLFPFKDVQDAIDAALDNDKIDLRGNFIDSKLTLPTDKNLYFYSELNQTTFSFSVFDSENDYIFNQNQSNCYKKFVFENINFENAFDCAINIESALKFELINCTFKNNGWNKDYLNKLSFLTDYNQTQAGLQTFYSSSDVSATGAAIKIKNTPIVSLSQGEMSFNNNSIVLENCGIEGKVFISRIETINNLKGVKLINCENVTGYNMAYANNASNGLEVTGGINNRFALSVFQNNWGSDVVTDGVSNTKFRDNDLTNSNKSTYNVDGTVSNDSAFLIKGMIARPERKFLLEILDTQIHSTDNNTKGDSYKGIEFDSSLSMLGAGENIINIDDVGFIGFHDQIHLGNADITNIKVTRGDCRHQDYTGSSIVPALNGDFYELPYSSHVTRVNFPDFSLDGSATTVILKDSLTNLIVNSYPVNLIHVDATTMNLMMGDKIQVENMDRANISVNGNLLNLSTDQSTANTLNSMFERTEVGGGDVDPPTPTLTGDVEEVVSGTNYNPTYMTLGLPDGDGNQTLISNQTGDNRGDVWSQIPMDQLGEFTQFQTDSAGGGKRFYVGFSRADQLTSLGDGIGNGHEGLQWSLAIYEGYNAPWTFYGDQSGYNYSSFFSDKEAFRLHSGILTNKVTWKVGIDANDGRFYVYFWSIIDLEWKYVAKTSYSLVNGDYHAVVRFYTQGGGMYGDFTNYRFPETDPVLTWNYIESPDGVFHYPLFSTIEEAEFADTQEGGTGTYHTHVYVDDVWGTTWYMPDSLMYHDQNAAPTGSTLGSFTDIVWNEIPTDVDSNYAPTPFSDQTIYVNEGDNVNLQIAPADATFTTSIGGIPAWTLNGSMLQGTAPEVTGDNVTNPSDTTTVTVYRTNSYGTSQGTLTIVINNLDAPVTPITGFTLAGGTPLVDSDTMDDGSVVSIDDQVNDGNRFVFEKEWLDNYVLPAITSGSGTKAVWIGFASNTANWSSISGADFDLAYQFICDDSTRANNNFVMKVYNQGATLHSVGIGSLTSGLYDYVFINDGTELKLGSLIESQGHNAFSKVYDTSNSDWKFTSGVTGLTAGAKNVYIATQGTTLDLSTAHFGEGTEPATPTNLTSWSKALDFNGSNQHAIQVDSSYFRVPMKMGGVNNQVSAPTSGQTVTSGHPWATVAVFKSDTYNSNQHVWNVGEGAGTTDDNIYLRRDANRNLYFGWGRDGDRAECFVGTISNNIGGWHAVYVGFNGTRLGSGATTTQMANCFDIRYTSAQNSWALSSNLSTSLNWDGACRMNRSYDGSMTIGGRGANRSFRGKVASFVTTTLRVGVSMPSDAEIAMMITDPIKWLNDYKVGVELRLPWQSINSGFNFSLNDGSSNYSTQVWLMGDGTNDSYSNMIRNQVHPSDQNYTKLNLISMVSNDFETVNINGLSN